jgi:hypothetical protein
VKPPRKVKRKHGYVWEVRYREGGRHRSRTFDRKTDAEDFQAEVRRRKRLGTISHLHAGEALLADFGVEWWRIHARPNLERSTLRRYSQVWDKHVLPRLGVYRLQELTPEVVADFRAELSERGVGDATVRKAMFMLQGVMGLAVLHGHIASNPVKAVRKPRQVSRTVRPLAPESVERIRLQLGARDATLVSVLAYAGLRPRRGSRVGLAQRPRAHDSCRSRHCARRRERHKDQRNADGAAARSACYGSRGVATRIRWHGARLPAI